MAKRACASLPMEGLLRAPSIEACLSRAGHSKHTKSKKLCLVMTMPNNKWRTRRSGVGTVWTDVITCCRESRHARHVPRLGLLRATSVHGSSVRGARVAPTCRLIRFVHPQHASRPKSGGSFASTDLSSLNAMTHDSPESGRLHHVHLAPQ